MEENKNLYSNGLPFDGHLAKNLEEQVGRVKGKKASLLIIDGLQGEGKTTLLVEIMDEVNRIYGLPPVKLDLTDHPQMAMGNKEFIRFFRQAKDENLVILGYDEAMDYNKRGSMTRLNQILNEVFSKFRGFRIIIVMALPNFCKLDDTLFDLGIPRGLLHCRDRDDNYGTFDAYSLSGMNWIRFWFDKLPKGAKNMAYGKVIPNFRGQFKDLEYSRSAKLDILSTRSKQKSLSEAEIEAEGLMGYNKLATKCARSIIWVRQAVSKLNIKSSRLINRTKYFDEYALNRLIEYANTQKAKKKGRKRLN